MTDNKSTKHLTGISISQEEKLIVDGLKERLNVSFSKALGIIIREWAVMRDQYVTIPKVGKIKPDGTITFSSREYAEYVRDFPNTIDPRD